MHLKLAILLFVGLFINTRYTKAMVVDKKDMVGLSPVALFKRLPPAAKAVIAFGLVACVALFIYFKRKNLAAPKPGNNKSQTRNYPIKASPVEIDAEKSALENLKQAFFEQNPEILNEAFENEIAKRKIDACPFVEKLATSNWYSPEQKKKLLEPKNSWIMTSLFLNPEPSTDIDWTPVKFKIKEISFEGLLMEKISEQEARLAGSPNYYWVLCRTHEIFETNLWLTSTQWSAHPNLLIT